jgi:hypothetical protein
MEGIPQKFTSPEEEIAFLRQQIANKERALLSRSAEVDAADVETLGREQIKEYVSFTPKMVLDPSYELTGEALVQSIETVNVAADPVEEVMQLAYEKGIRNALTVLEKVTNAYVIDEVHRQLIEHIKAGAQVADLKEGVPPWHVLHMTLYEVTLPAQKTPDGKELQLAELVGTMQQLFAGLRTIGSAKEGNHFVIEVAVADKSDDIIFYIAVPNEFKNLLRSKHNRCFLVRYLRNNRTTTISTLMADTRSLVMSCSKSTRSIPSKLMKNSPATPLKSFSMLFQRSSEKVAARPFNLSFAIQRGITIKISTPL